MYWDIFINIYENIYLHVSTCGLFVCSATPCCTDVCRCKMKAFHFPVQITNICSGIHPATVKAVKPSFTLSDLII